jgi:hypothetical protein
LFTCVPRGKNYAVPGVPDRADIELRGDASGENDEHFRLGPAERSTLNHEARI